MSPMAANRTDSGVSGNLNSCAPSAEIAPPQATVRNSDRNLRRRIFWPMFTITELFPALHPQQDSLSNREEPNREPLRGRQLRQAALETPAATSEERWGRERRPDRSDLRLRSYLLAERLASWWRLHSRHAALAWPSELHPGMT